MHKVLLNRLGGLSLPRKTDCPDMTIVVYHGPLNNNTTQQHSTAMKTVKFANSVDVDKVAHNE